MFDIGFWELFFLFLLTLFVLGPEKLPEVASYLGKQFGKVQRYFSSVKDQIDSEEKKIIEFLPDDKKEVLKYRYYNDLSFKEISEKTGVSINTSLGRMRYALINLRNIIKDKNIILTN